MYSTRSATLGIESTSSSPPIRLCSYSPLTLLHFRYTEYLSKKQAAELVAPHKDTLELVHSWLGRHGVPSSSILPSHAGGWLMITGVPTSQADGLLGASYQLYRHTGTNSTEPVLRTVSYAIPAALHAHVQMVAPTTYFPSPRKPSIKEAAVMINATGELVNVLSKRAGLVSPSFLRTLYKTEAYVPVAMDKNGLGVLGLENQYPSKEDFTKFMKNYRKDAVATDFTVEQINNGGNDPNNPGVEASLDTQYAAAMSFPTQQIFYSTGGYMTMSPTNGKPVPGDALLEWLNFLFKEETNTPPTISISYGFAEDTVPPAYTDALCDLFAKLGAIGVSVLAGSGDHGVGRGECIDSSGNIMFRPMFPATCTCISMCAIHMRRMSLTRPPRFCRSPCHQCRWHDVPRPRDHVARLRGRLLTPLYTPGLPSARGGHLSRASQK